MLDEFNFFEQRESSNKCAKCTLFKKKLCSYKSPNNLPLKKVGTGVDLCVILEYPEFPNYLDKLSDFISQFGIVNYTIVSGLSCRPDNLEIPSPMYIPYKQCSLINESEFSKYKVIVTSGRAIYSITQNSDLNSWHEFVEYHFNPTYFLTGIKWEKKIRVYPIPSLFDWVEKDNFERFYTFNQFKRVLKHIKEYIPESIEPYNLTQIENPNEFLKSHLGEKKVAWDTETSGLDHFDPKFKVGVLTLAFDSRNGYFLDYEKVDKGVLSEFFKDKYQILANGKFDQKAVEICGGVKNVNISEDIPVLFHLLSTERNSNSIKALAWLLGLGGYDEELDEYKTKYRIENYLHIPHKIMFKYSTLDAIVTYRLYELAVKLSRYQPNVYKAYKENLIPSFNPFLEMEYKGIDIKYDYLNDLNANIEKKIKTVEAKIFAITQKSINLNSPDQVAKTLEELGLPSHGRSDKKFYKDAEGKEVFFYKTGKPQLKRWRKEKYEIADLLLKYKGLMKLKTSFVGSVSDREEITAEEFFNFDKITSDKVEGIVKFIKSDHRIHPTFNPGRTASYRSSCYGPNLQQSPKSGEEGKEYRPIFKVPGDDFYFWEADYSGFQLRIAQIYSQDPVMKRIFEKDGDMHSITAQAIFCRDLSLAEFLKVKNEEPYKTYRKWAKFVNFGFIFGRSAHGFQPDIEDNWTDEDVMEYIEKNSLPLLNNKNNNPDPYLTVAAHIRKTFFKTYPELNSWIETQHEFAKLNGFVESWHGIRRHLPELTFIGKDSNMFNVSNYLNASVNGPVQTFEAFYVYKALPVIQNQMREQNLTQSWLMAMIHDSIGGIVHKSEIRKLYDIVIPAMEDRINFDIPLTAEFGIGKVFGYGKDLSSKEELNEWLKKEGIE